MDEVAIKGLTQSQAEIRLKEFGRNEVGASSVTSVLFEFLKFFKDPMALMMLALALVYFLLGEKRDALIMLIAFIPVSAVDVFLEVRADRALKALKSTFQRTAHVYRDGVLREISIQEIVPGDWVALEEGQTVPADGVIKTSAHFSVSEASLTGESLPIDKSSPEEVYAGTTILTGRAVIEVTRTGVSTRFGKIAELVQLQHDSSSPLQKKVNRLVLQIVRVAFVLVICLLALEMIRGKSFLESLLISLTFGMASVPEEFPLVFTLYLSLGAWRLSQSGVLVKALPSVETLGSVNVICTDKTGTLTEGRFVLNEMISFSNDAPSKQFEIARLACEPEPIDLMDRAIHEKVSSEVNMKGWSLIHDYPFDKMGRHMSHVWRHESGEMIIAMKGATEGVLAHCSDSLEIKKQILLKAEELSSKGFRLLGLAAKSLSATGVREKDEVGLEFVGIMVFSDPIRNSAKSAIEICQKENVMVKMITGDHPLTAHAIADELGLLHSHDALYTGEQLSRLSESERFEAFRKGAIFSRVTPEQKYELVRALKKDGMIVAMTGDGVNDAPAMKIADIGISMGETATDAARATAKMVLTQSDFNGIVHAITEGKRIFSNLRKSFSYLISFHIPVVLLSFLPPLFNLNEILMPVHIVLLELIVHPVSAFAFENLSAHSVKKSQGLIDQRSVMTSVLAGIMASLFSILFFVGPFVSLVEEKRTLAFLTVLFANMGFVLLEAWPSFSKRLLAILGVLFISAIAMSYLPAVSLYFHFAQVSIQLFMIALVAGLFASLPSFMIKRWRHEG